MEIIGLVLFYIVMALGFLLLPFGVPGTVLIGLDALVYGWLTRFQKLSVNLVLGLLAIAVVAEVADNVMTAAGAKKYGTSRKGIIASMAGAMLGAIVAGHLLAVTGIVGLALGPVLGAFAGGFLAVVTVERMQGKDKDAAVRAGYGAVLGRVGGMVLKAALAVVMMALILRAMTA